MSLAARVIRRPRAVLGRYFTPRPALSYPVGARRYVTSAADLQFGQPLHETHPHLLGPGELTPGITAFEYASRRADLARQLPSRSIAILAAADVKFRSGVVFYKYHQDPNFLYLTGFNEPNALAIIEKTGSGGEHNFHLYVRPKHAREEMWEGSRSGMQAAQDVFNADEAGNIGNVLNSVSELVGGAREVYTDITTASRTDASLSNTLFGSAVGSGSLVDLLQKSRVKPLKPYMNELRVLKSDAEIQNLQIAGESSGRSFREAMGRDFRTERGLDTFLDFAFKQNGCEESAYVPVVAGGHNALQIHYVRNDGELEQGKLVTVDAGGEYGGYVTDITRAWPPLDDKFTPAQKDLYEMILGVQKACVSLCRETAEVSLDQLHVIAEQNLRQGLKDLGFDMSNNALDALFPHHLGHYVGLAVHDAPGHPRTARLRQGHCITVEPGVYVDEDERWPKHFRGMGIRIEDSVAIGKEEPLVLSQEAPKEVEDIEKLRARKAR